MRWRVLLTLLAWCGGEGCKAGGAPEEAAPAPPPLQKAKEKEAPTSPPAAEAYVLTPEKLEAYLRYQQKLIAIHEGLLAELGKLPLLPPAKGKAEPKGAQAAMRVLESKARAEEQARAEAGLDERDVRALERMVIAVINKRSLGRRLDASSAIRQWEAMREKVPAEQRAGLDASIQELKAQQEETVKLTEERRAFGEANVDLLLTREEELTRNHEAYLARLTGRQ